MDPKIRINQDSYLFKVGTTRPQTDFTVRKKLTTVRFGGGHGRLVSPQSSLMKEHYKTFQEVGSGICEQRNRPAPSAGELKDYRVVDDFILPLLK